jgi:hypothetical protein
MSLEFDDGYIKPEDKECKECRGGSKENKTDGEITKDMQSGSVANLKFAAIY